MPLPSWLPWAGLAAAFGVLVWARWRILAAKLDIDLDNLDGPDLGSPCDLFGHIYPRVGYVQNCRYCGATRADQAERQGHP